MRNCKAIGLALLLCGPLGCAHYSVNVPLQAFDEDEGYRFKNLSSPGNSEELFVVLTFSGGGTRAAALAYGVMEQLRDTRVTIGGQEKRLLDEVDVISSVSGGSFTAAYYAAFGDELFETFEHRFLKKNIERELLGVAVWSGIRLLSPTFSRTDLAAEYYGEDIFDRTTYGDLLRRGQRPFLIVNATDMTLGATFEFTQEQFDLLYSDLGAMPISRAVAASAAFPLLFSPLTLQNYTKGFDFKEPAWIPLGLSDRSIASRRYQRAQYANSYLDANQRPYVHLLDGGIADNLGTRTVVHSLATTDSSWSILRGLNLEKIKTVVVIIVNAKTESATPWDKREATPTEIDALKATVSGLQDNYTFDSAVMIQEHFDQLTRDAQVQAQCRELIQESCPGVTLPGGEGSGDVRYYSISVDFDSIEDAGKRGIFQKMKTRLYLPPDQVDALKEIAGEILSRSQKYQELVASLGGSMN